jgi:hypothetical protein
MRDLGHDAVGVGALRPQQSVMDDGAVAVVESPSTPAAVLLHGPLIAPSRDNPVLPRGMEAGSRPAEFVQTVVVDAEVVGDLVDHRDRDLFDHLLLRLTDVQKGLAVNGDRVG